MRGAEHRNPKPGDVVAMGNRGSHKSPAVRQPVRSAGAHLLFLLPCSPDPDLIEQAYRLDALRPPRSRDTLWRSVGTIPNRFTPDECAKYLRNEGYAFN